MQRESKICFTLMPFAGEFQDIYNLAIRPAIEHSGYGAYRADTIATQGNIIQHILKTIYEADLVIAELSGRNPNVLYELGVAHTLGKPTIMLTQDYTNIPFDLKAYRMIVYEPTPRGMQQLQNDLTRAILSVDVETLRRNPISDVLPQLPSRGEIEHLRNQLQLVQRRLTLSDAKRKELEEQLKKKTATQPTTEEIVRALIGDEATRALQQELAEKDRQIANLLAVPETTDEDIARLKQENRTLLDELQLLRSFLPVKPHWGIPSRLSNDNYVFVLMPFRSDWSDIVWEVIRNVVTEMKYECERADDKTGKFVMQDIWSGINAASFVIADLTEGNPNVTYEVGMCDVLGKQQILLAQNPKEVPFDFLGVRLLPYGYVHGGITKLKSDLRERIAQITKTS